MMIAANTDLSQLVDTLYIVTVCDATTAKKALENDVAFVQVTTEG